MKTNRVIGRSSHLMTADLAGTHFLRGTFLADRQRITLVVHHVAIVTHCQIFIHKRRLVSFHFVILLRLSFFQPFILSLFLSLFLSFFLSYRPSGCHQHHHQQIADLISYSMIQSQPSRVLSNRYIPYLYIYIYTCKYIYMMLVSTGQRGVFEET